MSNGILDLDALLEGKDDCLLPHSPEWFSGVQLAYPFDPDADCPLWRQYIETSMRGDKERMAILQEWAGYLLTGTNEHQKFLAIEGDGGNGKTVYSAGIVAMLGTGNCSFLGLEKFGGRFDLVTTIGKAVNICGEVSELDKAAEAELKQFTGGDMMQFDRKNRTPIMAKPTAKLMMSWNNRPRFKDRSDGLWRRMILVPFLDKPERVVKKMDSHEWWEANGQVPGILMWAIEGLRRLNEQGEFTKSEVVKASIDEFKLSANPALEFLKSYTGQNPHSRIAKNHLYELYQHFCEKTGHRFPLARYSFGKEVAKLYEFKTGKVGAGKDRDNSYDGIGFTTDYVFSMQTESHPVGS